MKDFFGFASYFTLNCRGRLISLETPLIMGILNLTPDSFSDGGKYNTLNNALLQAEKMIEEGASIIDIGAQSTRPNAGKISAQEEILRIGKTISEIKKRFPEVLVSLDTFYSDVVRFGNDEGIDLVNDISGGQFDENMFSTVAEIRLPYILMHIADAYENMHQKNAEKDILLEENEYFSDKIEVLYQSGIHDIILDPGFGFGKTIEQNHQLLDELEFIHFGKKPLLVGISRKSFIYQPLGKTPLDINSETQLLHRKALEKGAKIFRVHDVAEMKKTIDEFLGKE